MFGRFVAAAAKNLPRASRASLRGIKVAVNSPVFVLGRNTAVRVTRTVALMIGAAAAGCSTTPETARDGSGAIHRVATESAPAAPQKGPAGTAASRPPKSATPPVALEAYEVRESAFSD